MTWVAIGSERTDEFVERGGDAELFAESVDTEFVVTAEEVLHECMTADHDARRAVRQQPAHRSQACFQPAVIALHPVVRVHPRVVLRVREHILDGTDQRLRVVPRHLFWPGVLTNDAVEEPSGRSAVAAGGHEVSITWPC